MLVCENETYSPDDSCYSKGNLCLQPHCFKSCQNLLSWRQNSSCQGRFFLHPAFPALTLALASQAAEW